jgi:hypothetical protein
MEQNSKLWIGGVAAVVLGAAVLAATARAPTLLPPEAEKALAKKEAAEAGVKEPVSEKLEDTEGVIKPPKGIDPEIRVPAPEGGTMKVIIPPGEPGGDPTVQPK